MQYETIILELLTRIKTLEADVQMLKQAYDAGTVSPSAGDSEVFSDGNPPESAVSYKKVTDQMIENCYFGGKKVYDGRNAQEVADEIAEKTGMNRNSTIMYLYAVEAMLAGTVYKRAISAKAMQKYFDMIFEEYGRSGLKKAIKATRLHIKYRRDCGHTVDSIEAICDRNETRIDQRKKPDTLNL